MTISSEWVVTGDGIRRRIVMDGEKLMQVEVHFQAGATGTLHSHPHEQTTFVIKGRVQFTIDGEDREYSTGQVIHIPSNVIHNATALEEVLLLDTFYPPRDDFRVSQETK